MVRIIKEAKAGDGSIVSDLLLQTPSDLPLLQHIKPTPLASILAGAALGGGVGYLGASALGSVLPRNWDKKRLRRNAAVFGALAGSAPGLEWGILNRFADEPFNSDAFLKESSLSGLFNTIDVSSFNDTVWNDPRVANRLNPPTQAMLTGFVTGAANLPGKRTSSDVVTPLDMGRMAVGMGSGYASGVLVGKALGALTGMPEPAQDRLKSVGLWAGIAKSLVPSLIQQT